MSASRKASSNAASAWRWTPIPLVRKTRAGVGNMACASLARPRHCARRRVRPSELCAAASPGPVASITRLAGKWRELQLVGPARAVLGVQIPERVGDLDRVDHKVGPVLHP